MSNQEGDMNEVINEQSITNVNQQEQLNDQISLENSNLKNQTFSTNKDQPLNLVKENQDEEKDIKKAPKKKKQTNTVKISKDLLNQLNSKLEILNDTLNKKKEENIQLQKTISQLEQQQKKFNYEQEGFQERNNHISALLDKQKEKYEILKKKVVDLGFNNKELNEELNKLDEITEVYKQEARDKFQKEIEVAELKEENAKLRKKQIEFNKEEINIRMMELEKQNARLEKQNQIMKENIDRIQEGSKSYINGYENQKKQIQKFDEIKEGLMNEITNKDNEINSLQKKLQILEKQSKEQNLILLDMRAKYNKDVKSLKREMENLKNIYERIQSENEVLRKKCQDNEVNYSIEKIPSLDDSQIDHLKKNKIIMQTLVKAKQNLEMQNNLVNKQNDKLRLNVEVLQEKLKEKESILQQSILYISNLENKKSDSLDEEQVQKIKNTKVNCSEEELRDLLEGLLRENLILKMQNNKN